MKRKTTLFGKSCINCASSTAKRLAVACILFKAIAWALFPFTIPLLIRASKNIDAVTLLAGYHTAYYVLGVAVLLPVIERFTRFVERILPEHGSPLTRCLDPAALETPIAAEEAVRRTVALSLGTMCGSIGEALMATNGISVRARQDTASITEASDALPPGVWPRSLARKADLVRCPADLKICALRSCEWSRCEMRS